MNSVLRITLLAAATAALFNAPVAMSQPSKPASQALPRTAPESSHAPKVVVVLTESLGDTGRELLAAGVELTPWEKFDVSTTQALLYVDVDGLSLANEHTADAFALAAASGWDVLLESNTWDDAKVRTVAKELFPELNTNHLQNTTVLIRAKTAKSSKAVEDSSPTAMLAMFGTQPEDLRTYALEAATESSKRREADSYLAHFANRAYEDNPASSWRNPITGHSSVLLYARDVVKVWEVVRPDGVERAGTQCLVAWRGSTFGGFGGDWARNFQNQFGPARSVPGDQSDSPARAGAGYVARLNNQARGVREALDRWGCDWVFVTGHSLGGGMAHLHAYTLRFSYGIARVESYNPARVGNWAFVNLYRGFMGTRTRVFCRRNDPVASVPAGLHHVGSHSGNQGGCDLWAPRASTNPVTNHSIERWF